MASAFLGRVDHHLHAGLLSRERWARDFSRRLAPLLHGRGPRLSQPRRIMASWATAAPRTVEYVHLLHERGER